MGVSPVFVRLAEIGPFASAFWRVALAMPILFFWAAWEARDKRNNIKAGSASRRCRIAHRSVFRRRPVFSGIWRFCKPPLPNATLLSCLAPVWVVLLSGVIIGEPVERNAYTGLAFCITGAAFLIGPSLAVAPHRLWGDVFGFLTSVFFGLYFLAVRVARRTHGAGALIFMSTVITAIILLGVAMGTGQSLWPNT